MRPKKTRDRHSPRTAPDKAPAASTPPKQTYRLETPLICLALIFMAWVAFGGLCGSDYEFFNFDDDEYITQNPQVQAGLTADSIYWAFTTFHSNNWHPLTWMSLQLDYTIFGLEPWGYHYTNVVLHAANAVLLFLFLQYVTGATWRSAIVAGLFLLHPQRVESVAWASERKDVLSTLFWMLTLWAYVWYVQRPNWRRYSLVVVTFALGLLAKQMLVTLPFVLLLLDYWPLKRIADCGLRITDSNPQTANRNPQLGLKRLVAEKLPLLALSLAACVITIFAQEGYRRPLEEFPLYVRVLNAAYAYVAYLGKMFWPADLCVLYLHPGDRRPQWEGLAAGVLVLVITLAVLSLRARPFPYLAVGWLWYLGTLVPVIGLVQVAVQAYADRYTYVPMIGINIMLVWSVADLAERRRWPVQAVGLVAGAVLLGCLMFTLRQVQFWKTPLDMWQHVVEVEPDNYLAHGNVGQLLGDHATSQADIDTAIYHFRKCIDLEPKYDKSYLNLGIMLQRLGKLDEATENFAMVLRLNPRSEGAHNKLGFIALAHGDLTSAVEHFTAAVEIAPGLSDAHNNLGTALLYQGKWNEARRYLLKANALSPRFAVPYTNLGLLLGLQGKYQEAEQYFRQALQLNPHEPSAPFYLAWSLNAQGQTDAARRQYREAISAAPHWPKAIAHQAWILATRPDAANRNSTLAVQQAQTAHQASPNPDGDVLDALAAAYADAGRFTDAIAAAKEAIAISPPEQKDAREKRLQLYEAHQPFRETQR